MTDCFWSGELEIIWNIFSKYKINIKVNFMPIFYAVSTT